MNHLRRLLDRAASPRAFPLYLLGLCVLAYGPLMPRLGLYWDDFPIAWIASTMGGDGLARYFSTNRPVWGLLYRLTTPLIGTAPLPWHVLALLLRWATGLVLWALLRRLWPGRERFAGWAAAVFVLYPGFSQQFIAFMYSHFFLVLLCYLLSLLLMVRSVQQPRRYALWMVAAAALSLFNMLAMEYFLLLDLLRPLVLWAALTPQVPDRRARLKRTLLAWIPYLVLFTGAIFWRSVLFGFQTYQPTLLARLRADPLRAILQLLPVVLRDVWATVGGIWQRALTLPAVEMIGSANLRRYWLFVAGGSLFALAYGLLTWVRARSPERGWRIPGWVGQPLLIGLAAVVIAGGPFWLTDLQIGLVYPNDRFTLPFMLGASLLAASLLAALPLPGWLTSAVFALALGFTIGFHYQTAVTYHRDWSVQRSLFWQMTWRMPALEPGTALLSNELPVVHYTDNSLSAPLNWTYDPHNDPAVMRYMLLYPTLRKTSVLGNLQPGDTFTHDFLATTFTGSTDRLLVFYYLPPGCFRVLDPEVEIENWNVPVYVREVLPHSNRQVILPEPPAGETFPRPPAHIYGSEIERGWCYHYEQADLARQMGDWQAVAAIGELAWAQGDYPNDPIERFPFIEGYAHTGNWARAWELSQEAYTVTPIMGKPLCRLWTRIARETPATPEREETLRQAGAGFGCTDTTP